MKNNLVTVLICLGIFAGISGCSLVLTGCGHSSNAKVYEADDNETDKEGNVVNSSELPESSDDTEVVKESEYYEQEYVYVQLCGAVVNPGVYKILSGTRVYEAVEVAGGATQEADTSAVNMAKPVADEMQIYIPVKGETSDNTVAGYGESTKEELIDINKATKEELMELPGIGETRAEAIIAYREEHGVIKDITELMNVSGIKEAAFSKIKDKIKV